MGLFDDTKTPEQLRDEARARRIRPPKPPRAEELFSRLGFAGWSSYKFAPVYFPVTKIGTSYKHDLGPHKFYKVDGVRFEPTGLDAVSFVCEIPFLNHIVPGAAERWEQPLYPTAFLKFVVATQDRSEGLFSHPEFGDILCQVDNVAFDHDAKVRGGVVVKATFKQTLSADLELDRLGTGASPITGAIQAASDLDVTVGDLRALVPTLPVHERDFKDFMNELEAFGDAIGSFGDKLTGPFKRIAHQANRMVDGFDRAGKGVSKTVKSIVKGDPASPVREALTAQGREAARRLQNGLEDARRQGAENGSGRNVRVFIVGRPTSASVIALRVGSNVSDLLALNPSLAASPEVPQGMVVRYYGNRL